MILTTNVLLINLSDPVYGAKIGLRSPPLFCFDTAIALSLTNFSGDRTKLH